MNIFRGITELPFRRAIQTLRNRVSDLNRATGYSPVYMDQYPGKASTWCFSKLYGPIDLVGAANATTNQPVMYLPKGTNILTGRDGTFFWESTNIFAYAQRNALPGELTQPDSRELFDPFLSGGGGTQVQNFQGFQAINNGGVAGGGIALPLYSRLTLELDLYDKKRDRSITNGRLPTQVFNGGAFDFRSLDDAPRFDPDTEIEPRLWVTSAVASNNAGGITGGSFVFFVNVVFKGVMISQEITDRETLMEDSKRPAVDRPAFERPDIEELRNKRRADRARRGE